LADFQQHLSELESLGVGVVALSADNEADAAALMKLLGLGFPVAYGLDVDMVQRAIGCYTGLREGHEHLQPASFVLAPDGRILHAVYSSGKVGRLTASDVLVIARDRLKTAATTAA
jgi:peroxiredoxin